MCYAAARDVGPLPWKQPGMIGGHDQASVKN